ncbi:MAG: hypothetical protein H6621_03625 [Halobacteriovoraceae bacterium]|nr:hypothetical protein [Halobacteriovoraceae bacterium]MCB9094138.1 hypothetical protein [Halobacteriovoraceae bacterium]
MLASKYLVALNFNPNSLFLKKVENFRKRYSTSQKSWQNKQINLPIIAPFELNKNSSRHVFDEFEEEVNSFFISENEKHFLKLTSIGVYQHKKKYLLYINTQFSVDFEYCIESLNHLKKNHVVPIKGKESKTPYLKLASFQGINELEEAIEAVKREFFLPMEVGINGVSLYENNSSHWKFMKRLINFQEKEDFCNEFYQLHNQVV